MITQTRAANATGVTGSSHRPFPIVWGVSIFLSAFLLFEIQPIVAKIILPWFGGGAGVWTVSLMFFQVGYLLGNLYAHWLVQQTGPSAQTRCHAALLAASLLLLPVIPRPFWKATAASDPSLKILGLLAVTAGLPFFLLSATSPLLQAWYSRARRDAEPYRFYALSNGGSLLALLIYPVIVEPRLTAHHQAWAWSVAYACFVVLCAALAFRRLQPASTESQSNGQIVGAEGPTYASEETSSIAPSWGLRTLWVALAADASVFLLAITNHLSQNVAAVPLLWVLPLSLYLLSLILCFGKHNWYTRPLFLRLLGLALAGMAFAFSPELLKTGPMVQVPLFCGCLFICCMVCHGELVRLKPEPEHLTTFYLMVSLGGALGGVFVGAIAPHIFRSFYELPIAMAGCAILLRVVLHLDPSTPFYRGGLRVRSFLITALIGLLIISLAVVWRRQTEQARVLERNFYGVLKVSDLAASEGQPARRVLVNGIIVHGMQLLDPAQREQPTAYYSRDSGIGMALLAAGQQANAHIGVVGLGTGTIAAYGVPGERITFYEINPAVVQIAKTQFTFLSDSKAQIDIVAGDARLSLEDEPPRGFAVLAVDAFSGDAIPVHLLTREAFALYMRHLRPDGVLAIHISNKYLDLQPIVESGAASAGANSILVISPADPGRALFSSTWMLASRSEEALANFPEVTFLFRKKPNLRPWTDDYSNLFQILR